MSAPIAIVLAAGKSTRMKSALPKVVHHVCGRPMVDYVLDVAREAGAERIIAVVGHRADYVEDMLSRHKDVEFARQTEQKGTGHAVMMCRPLLESHDGPVFVLAGDTPLLKASSLKALLDEQAKLNAAAVIGSARTVANQGLGRIVRHPDGRFDRIVEEKDASPEQRLIQEINTGCYSFDNRALLDSLDKLQPNNSQGEYYLTDCPKLMQQKGLPVAAVECFGIEEAMGVNTRVQLAEVTEVITRATLQQLMLSGVTIVNPSQTFLDPRVHIEPDTVIEPFTVIKGSVHIGADCVIGPHAVIEGPLEIPAGTYIGPFEHMRSTG